jgi:branched-chain amino acid transport system permease protein
MKPSVKTITLLLLVVALAFFPLLGSKFHTYLLIECFIYSVLAVSYYMLLGHTGLMSFGHAALFGIGAYASAITLIHFSDLPVALTVLVGGLSGLLCGFLIGLVVLRLTKIYLAFGTLALSQMIWAIAWKWRAVTGGDDGLTGWSGRQVTFPWLGQFSLTNITFLYYFVLFFALACVALCWYFTRTPFGETLSSIRSNQNRADFLGINVGRARLMVFAFSGFMAGMSGALFILFKKAAAPTFLDMSTSFNVLVMSVIGGYTSFLGPIVGSFVYVYMMEYLSSFTERWQLVMGAFFVLLILFYPKGIVGMVQQLAKKVSFTKDKRGVRTKC